MNNFKMRLGAFLVASCMFTTSVPVYATSTNSNNTKSSVNSSIEKTESKTSKVDDDVGIFEKIGRNIAPKLFASRSSSDSLDRFLDNGDLGDAPIRNIYDSGRNSALILKKDGTLYRRKVIGGIGSELETEMIRVKTNVKAMVGEYIFIDDKIYHIRNESAGSSNSDNYSFTEITTNRFTNLLPGTGIGDDDYLYNLGHNNATLKDKDISYFKDFKNRDFMTNAFINDGDLYAYNDKYILYKIKSKIKFKKVFSTYSNNGSYMTTRYAIGVDNKLYSTTFMGITEQMTPSGVGVDDIKYIYSVDEKEALLLTKSGNVYVKGSANFCEMAGYNKTKYEDWKKVNVNNIKQIYYAPYYGTYYVNNDNKIIHSGKYITYSYISGDRDWVCKINGNAKESVDKLVDLGITLDDDEFIVRVSDSSSRVELLTNKRCLSKGCVWDSGDPYNSNGLYGTIKFVNLEEDPVDPNLEPAKKAVEKVEQSLIKSDYDKAKDLVDKLKPSTAKDDLTKRLGDTIKKIDSNTPLVIETVMKNTNAGSNFSVFSNYNSDITWMCGKNQNNNFINISQGDYNKVIKTGHKNITSLVADNGKVAYLDNKGNVYVNGYQGYGEFGLGHRDDVKSYTKLNIPDVKNIYMNSYKMALLTNTGDVYMSKAFGNGFGLAPSDSASYTLEKLPIKDICKVRLWESGVALVDKYNDCYVTGYNDYGQLGLGDKDKHFNFVKVPLPNVQDVICVSSESTIFKSNEEYYGVGKNSYGELGTGDTKSRDSLTKLSLGDVKEIYGGYTSLFVLRNNNTAYACGYNSDGRLGVGSNSNSITSLTKVMLDNISGICVGSSHSLFVDGNFDAYSCGNNNFGQLGLGDNKNRNIPTKIGININKDPNLEPAKKAVEQAEKTYKRGDYDKAKDLVDKLKPSDTKEDLTKRLDEVLKKIVENDKNKLDLESATKAVEKSESTLSRDDYNKAKDLTDKLNSSSDKDSLVKRLDEVLDKIKEKEENGKKISDATKAAEKSESTLSKDDYDKAKDLVDKLSSSSDKDNLNKRLDEVLKKINKKEEDAKKLSEATKAVEKAESTLDKSDYNRAKELVDRLPTSSDKDDLNKRLEEVSEKINKKEEQNRLISEADVLVKKAEQSCKDDDKRKAQDAVNKIDNCREKDELQNRLDNIKIISKSDLEQFIMDYDKKVTINQSSNLHTLQDLQSLENEGNNLRDKIDDSLSTNEASELISKLNIPLNKVRTEIGAINKAEGLVKKVKLDKTVDNFIDAFVDVSALINSAEKTRLKNELFAIFDDIIKSMSDKEIKDLFDKLKDLVDKGTLEKEDVLTLADRIPNKELGKIIKDKLNGIDNSKDEEYKKLLEQLINLATVAVEKAESTGNRGDIDLARVQVNKLPDCSEKDLLNSRLDAIKEVADKGPNSDSGNMDIIAGVKSMISLDLSNVGLDFDDYTGVNNVERKNAVVASITSNMPYSFSVTMLNAITGTDSKNVLKDKSLGIKLSSVGNSYIPLIPDSPLVLVKHHESGEDMKFNLDFKLNASPGSPVDKYKTNLKFEAIQD